MSLGFIAINFIIARVRLNRLNLEEILLQEEQMSYFHRADTASHTEHSSRLAKKPSSDDDVKLDLILHRSLQTFALHLASS